LCFEVCDLDAWVTRFLRDAKIRNLSPRTISFYRRELKYFTDFLTANSINEVPQITADFLRQWLFYLETERKRNAGGRHASYRAIRAFMFWYEAEAELQAWKNPIRRVKPPKVIHEPITGVKPEHVKAMLQTCGDDVNGVRDKAILLFLFDSGARACEFLDLNLDDIDLVSGAVEIRHGKGGKSRTVFIGKRSREALRDYLNTRTDDDPALWFTRERTRLSIKTLQQMIKRRAVLVGVPVPSPHDFRRAFALAMLRAGVDIFNIQKLMGHAGLDVLRLYLALNTGDARQAHERGGPADNFITFDGS
jgi:integrase/recombinase XerD